ncbi:hypothetical protein BSQ99_06640 [Serratia liquefaciens]|nr:hypothetical protein BSQ99_06640 [Serratia liquefaciens]
MVFLIKINKLLVLWPIMARFNGDCGLDTAQKTSSRKVRVPAQYVYFEGNFQTKVRNMRKEF